MKKLVSAGCATETLIALRPRLTSEGFLALRDAVLYTTFAALGRATQIPAIEFDRAIECEALPPIIEFPKGESLADLRPEVDAAGAAFYVQAICAVIGRAAKTGALQTYSKPKGAGKSEPIPREAWEADTHFLRFKGYSCDPADWGRSGSDCPCWVLVDENQIKSMWRALAVWRAELPMFDGDVADEFWGQDFFCGMPVKVQGSDDHWHITPPHFPSFDAATLGVSSQSADCETRELVPTGDPGRPEKGKTRYLNELKRRAEAGTLEDKVAQQARALANWYRTEFPYDPPPSPGTVENSIRQAFRDAKV